MNFQEVRDRLKLVFTLMSDSHYQVASKALNTDSLLSNELRSLSVSSLSRLRQELLEHSRRVSSTSDEVFAMIREVK
jgi:hypothetical protein